MLRLGIVVLGLRVSLSAFVDIGFAGLAVVAATVTATFLGTRRLGRLLRVDADLVDLVAAGFAICGAAAVAAMAESTRPRDRSVAVAVALVTVFGSIAMLIVPWAAGALDLSARQSGIWAGASIHEIAQVVVAAAIIGPTALATATTVKLARVVLLAPVIALHATRVTTDTRNGLSSLRVPWFVAGFLLAALGRSTGLVPGLMVTLASTLATTLLAAGMFGLGLDLQGRDLRSLSPRVLLLGAGSTGIVILVPLVSLLVVSGGG